MGECKQLLPLGDRPAVVHSLEAVIIAGIEEIIVVIGPEGEAVAEAVSRFPVTIARNHDPASDMAGSVRTGLREVDSAATGVFVALADHPLVQPETYRALLWHHLREPDTVLIPVFNGRRGHPTLFPRSLLEEIHRCPTLREVLASHPDRVQLVPVPDQGVALDMDTPEDYHKVTGIFAARQV